MDIDQPDVLAEVGEAMGAMLRGTTQPLLDRVIAAADQIESIPFPFDGARLRLIARLVVHGVVRSSPLSRTSPTIPTMFSKRRSPSMFPYSICLPTGSSLGQ